MKKKDLRNGMVVEYRDGDLRMVLSNSLLGVEGFEKNKLCFYNDDFKDKDNDTELDIMKVYDLTSDVLSFSGAFDRGNLKIIWERKETKKVFRAWKYVEEAMQRNGGSHLKESFKQGWVQLCEGLTRREIDNLGKYIIISDAWLVEEDL